MQKKHIQQINAKRESGLFNYLLILTSLFILVEISSFIQSSELYLGEFKLVADRLKVPGSIAPGIVYFFLVQLTLHLFFVFFVWSLARLMGIALHCSWKMTEKIGFYLWVLSLSIVLLANQIYYPNSKFAYLMNVLINTWLAKFLFIIAMLMMGMAFLVACWGLLKKAPKFTMGIIGLLVVAIFLQYRPVPSVVKDAATAARPNIILIGIDSLRPDFLGYFGYEKITPHLDAFLDQSAVFSDALTPIARTFPSWVSILTGEYPKHNGVRFNLAQMNNFKWQRTLPTQLHREGYETIFATDETRFSNIDERFGFDKIVTPPIGFNDFVLGAMNDFPIANLFVNTSIGKYLLPYSYGNRPAYKTYNPDTFLDLLAPTLAQPRTKPLFLIVHFCLPHYPYIWGEQKLAVKSLQNYQASVQRMDKLFNDFLALLQQNKLLEQSMVVVLSDHGEAIELPGDRVTAADLFVPGNDNKNHILPHFYPKSFDYEEINQSAGHGTDILGLSQYHSVLAFRFYGDEKNQNRSIPGRVSLLDIKPTVLAKLHLPPDQNDDGYALLNSILGQGSVARSKQDFFMETDFSPQSIRSVHPEARDLLFEGIDFFQVDPITTRITVKKTMAKLIITSKQYANLSGDWILALYPQSLTTMTPILVNLATGEWTNDLRTPFAKQSPASRMLKALKEFYGADVTSVQNIPA